MSSSGSARARSGAEGGSEIGEERAVVVDDPKPTDALSLRSSPSTPIARARGGSIDGQGPTREWVTFDDPKEEGRRWQIDVTFLLSSWECIFGCGCQGVLTEPAPELVQGCCSYGAHFSDRRTATTS